MSSETAPCQRHLKEGKGNGLPALTAILSPAFAEGAASSVWPRSVTAVTLTAVGGASCVSVEDG